MRKTEVTVSPLGLVSLRARKHDCDRYEFDEDEWGTITLTPLPRVPAVRIVPDKEDVRA
jgi:hypothetical protein